MQTEQDKIKALFGGKGQGAAQPLIPPDTPATASQEDVARPLTLGTLAVSKAPVVIPPEFETRHILMMGTTGSGKSQAIYNLQKTIRVRGQKCLIMDHGGETLQRFYRPGKDHIFNPFDKRGVSWNIFNEAHRRYDWAKIAKFIVKDGEGDSASWHSRAQNFMTNGMSQLSKRGETFRCTDALLQFMLKSELHGKDDPTTLESLMQGTSSQPLFAPGADRALSSIHGIVSDSLTAMEHLLLRDQGSNSGDFSMADWVKDEDDDSWTFLSYSDASFAAIQPLFGILVASAIQNVMELRPDSARRFFFFLDEIASLGRVPHLVDALTKFRKYGGCVVAGLQSYSQLEEIYGDKGAQTLMSCFNTKVLLRTSDASTAEAESLLVGSELRTEEGRSETTQANGETSLGTSQSLQERRIVMPRTFQTLPDLEGYALVGGSTVAQHIKIPYANLQPITIAEETDEAIFEI